MDQGMKLATDFFFSLLILTEILECLRQLIKVDDDTLCQQAFEFIF